MRLLLKGRRKGTPSYFLTNKKTDSVFPVFEGDKYTPAKTEKHFEIVRKIHDSTKNPNKKAQHKAYLEKHGKAAAGGSGSDDGRAEAARKRALAIEKSASGRQTGKSVLEQSLKLERRWLQTHRELLSDAEKAGREDKVAEHDGNARDSEALIAAMETRLAEIKAAKRVSKDGAQQSTPVIDAKPGTGGTSSDRVAAKVGEASGESEADAPHGEWEISDKDKIVLSFSKADYKALPEKTRDEVRRYFNFSRQGGEWISKARADNSTARRIAREAGFRPPEDERPGQVDTSEPYVPTGVAGLKEGQWHKAKPDDIDYRRAKAAYEWSSMSPERRAKQEQESYVAALDDAARKLVPFAGTPEKKAQLQEMLEDYRAGLIPKINARLDASSRTASVMVTGPSKFPTRRNEKALGVYEKRTAEMLEYQQKALARMRRELVGSDSVMSYDSGAVGKLQEKIDEAEADHKHYLAVNKIVKSKRKTDEEKIRALMNAPGLNLSRKTAEKALQPDFAGRTGIPSYVLSNNRANINRMKKRIEDIKGRYGDLNKGAQMRILIKGRADTRGKPDAFITVGASEGKDADGKKVRNKGTVVPVWGMTPHPSKPGKLVATMKSGKVLHVDEDRHEQVKKKVAHSQAEAGGQLRLFGRAQKAATTLERRDQKANNANTARDTSAKQAMVRQTSADVHRAVLDKLSPEHIGSRTTETPTIVHRVGNGEDAHKLAAELNKAHGGNIKFTVARSKMGRRFGPPATVIKAEKTSQGIRSDNMAKAAAEDAANRLGLHSGGAGTFIVRTPDGAKRVKSRHAAEAILRKAAIGPGGEQLEKIAEAAERDLSGAFASKSLLYLRSLKTDLHPAHMKMEGRRATLQRYVDTIERAKEEGEHEWAKRAEKHLPGLRAASYVTGV